MAPRWRPPAPAPAVLACLVAGLLAGSATGLRAKGPGGGDQREAEACAQPLPFSTHTSEDDQEPPVASVAVPGHRLQMAAINGMRYLLFLPANWTPSLRSKFPVVVFLHGDGDGKFSVMYSQSLPRLLAKDQSTSFDNRTCWCLEQRYWRATAKREAPPEDPSAFLEEDEDIRSPAADCGFAEHFKAIVVMPQGWLPDDRRHGWDDRRLQNVQVITQHVLREYRGDPSRVVLTGQSMGGDGAWRFASARPQLWSAVNVVCAPAGWKVPGLMEGLPIWVVGDESDGLRGNDKAVKALKRRKRGTVRYTRYSDAPAPPDPQYRHMLGHASYDLIYRDPRLWEWALAQRNPAAAAEWAL